MEASGGTNRDNGTHESFCASRGVPCVHMEWSTPSQAPNLGFCRLENYTPAEFELAL